MKKKFLCIFLLFAALIQGSEECKELSKSGELTIESVITYTQYRHSLVVMTNGSIWMDFFSTRLSPGTIMKFDNYENPTEGNKYDYPKAGHYNWVLLSIGDQGDGYFLPYDSLESHLTIKRVLDTEYMAVDWRPFEVLILDNQSIIVMPMYHGGFSENDQVTIRLNKEEGKASLIRYFGTQGKSLSIPLKRISDRTFIASDEI